MQHQYFLTLYSKVDLSKSKQVIIILFYIINSYLQNA